MIMIYARMHVSFHTPSGVYVHAFEICCDISKNITIPERSYRLPPPSIAPSISSSASSVPSSVSPSAISSAHTHSHTAVVSSMSVTTHRPHAISAAAVPMRPRWRAHSHTAHSHAGTHTTSTGKTETKAHVRVQEVYYEI